VKNGWFAICLGLVLSVLSSLALATPRLECPCEIQFNSQTTATLKAKVVNTSSTSATGPMQLVLQIADDPSFSSFFELSSTPVAALAAGAATELVTYQAPAEFVDPDGRYFVRLSLKENSGQGFRTRDSIRMETSARLGYNFGEVYLINDTGGNVFLPVNPTFELRADNSFSLSITKILTEAFGADVGPLTFER